MGRNGASTRLYSPRKMSLEGTTLPHSTPVIKVTRSLRRAWKQRKHQGNMFGSPLLMMYGSLVAAITIAKARRLKGTAVYFFVVLEARSLKPNCPQGHAPPKALRQEASHHLGIYVHVASSWCFPSLCAFPKVSATPFSVYHTLTLNHYVTHFKCPDVRTTEPSLPCMSAHPGIGGAELGRIF